MATTTSNFGLSKPAYTDVADIAVINNNMDIIDTNLYNMTPRIRLSTTDAGAWDKIWAKISTIPSGGSAIIYLPYQAVNLLTGGSYANSMDGLCYRHSSTLFVFNLCSLDRARPVGLYLNGTTADGFTYCTAYDIEEIYQAQGWTGILNGYTGAKILDPTTPAGFYYITGATDYSPDGSGVGFCWVMPRNSASNKLRTVVWKGYNKEDFWYNYMPNSDNWHGWVKIATSTDLENKVDTSLFLYGVSTATTPLVVNARNNARFVVFSAKGTTAGLGIWICATNSNGGTIVKTVVDSATDVTVTRKNAKTSSSNDASFSFSGGDTNTAFRIINISNNNYVTI